MNAAATVAKVPPMSNKLSTSQIKFTAVKGRMQYKKHQRFRIFHCQQHVQSPEKHPD